MAAALAGLFFYSSCSPTEKAETKDYTRYVNTFIGAADNGHTFPGACYPFGMIQSQPCDGCSRLALLFRVYLSGFSDLGIHADASEWNRMYGLG